MFPKPISGVLFAALLCQPSVCAESPKADGFASIREQIARHHYDQAETSLWSIISREPENKQALFLLGKIRSAQNRLPEAEALFRRVVQIDKADDRGLEELCSVLLLEEKGDEALEIVQNAITNRPTDPDLRVQLARIYVDQKRYSDAAAILQKLPAGKLNVNTIPVRAAVSLGNGDRPGARSLISRLPVDSEIRMIVAKVFIDFDDPNFARELLANVPARTKATERFLYLMGVAEGKLGNSETANGFLKQALKGNPKSVVSLLALGEIAASRKQYSEAISYFELAHQADPESRMAYRDLIQAAIDSNSFPVAPKYSLEFEKKSSRPQDLYFSAAALLQARDFEAAERIFRKYLEVHSDDAKAHMGLGIALLNQERASDAKPELEQALKLDPKLSDAEYFLGVMALQKDDSDVARLHFEHVISAQPSHPAALFNLGLLAFRAGDLERARSYWESSEKSDPSNPELHYQLSLLYNRLGLKEQAQAQLERFRTLKPSIQPKGGFPDQQQ
jgi:tetratricopeptide (TPR) repeat protein